MRLRKLLQVDVKKPRSSDFVFCNVYVEDTKQTRQSRIADFAPVPVSENYRGHFVGIRTSRKHAKVANFRPQNTEP